MPRYFRWSPRLLALLVVSGVLVVGAPSVAGASGPSAPSLLLPSEASAPVPPFASGAAPTGASGMPPTAAVASGCTDQAAASNFHERFVPEQILPLQQFPANSVSVPTWSGSFTSDGVTYPYTMVGTDPAAGSVTTHVPVELIPLTLKFQGSGCVLEDSGAVSDIEASPLFAQSNYLSGGPTQYLDGLQRDNFWSEVSTVSADYHLLLDPVEIPAVTLQVPASQGLTFGDPSCDPDCGIVGGNWLLRQLYGLIQSLHISPATLAVFVPVNTFVTDENPEDCLVSCAYYDGYHYALLSPKYPHEINTFAMATYVDNPEVPAPYDFGSSVLSHEILEWANDPFDSGGRVRGQESFFANPTPPWTSPYYTEGTCLPIMEVADPLEGVGWIGKQPVGSSTIYAVADEAFLSWFARQTPSTSIDGLYDAGGVFSTYSAAC